MEQNRTFQQIMLSVEGIQAYLFSTGKLKEMIGASELTSSFPDDAISFCENVLHLTKATKPSDSGDWYVIFQKGAGVLRLLLPDRELARRLLDHMSTMQVEKYTGLPLFGACVPCEWSMEGVKKAYKEAKLAISKKRATQAVAPRSVWPFCRVAPLDGLPAVTKDQDDRYLSVESMKRRSPQLLTAAKRKFEAQIEGIIAAEPRLQGVRPEYIENIDDMMRDSPVQKIALLHMDGNDLGKLFRSAQERLEGSSPEKQNEEMLALSNLVDDANHYAFTRAMGCIIKNDLDMRDSKKKPVKDVYIVPARPLVLAGDDLTIILRADLSFDFADTYAAAFQDYTEEKGNPMSVGGGMVIMPSGYPFTQAFMMAEELTTNAKKLTCNDKINPRPSSIDYLVITNDVDDQLDALRERSFTARDGSLLTAKPFLCGIPRQTLTTTDDASKLDVSGYRPDASLADVLADAKLLEEILPSSQLRGAVETCREGRGPALRTWKKLHENLVRGLGGQKKDTLPTFERIFNEGSFFLKKDSKAKEESDTGSPADSMANAKKGSKAKEKSDTGSPADSTANDKKDSKAKEWYVTLLGDYLELKRLFNPLEEDA